MVFWKCTHTSVLLSKKSRHISKAQPVEFLDLRGNGECTVAGTGAFGHFMGSMMKDHAENAALVQNLDKKMEREEAETSSVETELSQQKNEVARLKSAESQGQRKDHAEDAALLSTSGSGQV